MSNFLQNGCLYNWQSGTLSLLALERAAEAFDKVRSSISVSITVDFTTAFKFDITGRKKTKSCQNFRIWSIDDG